MRNRGSVSRSAIVVLCVAALGMLGMDGQDSGPLVTPSVAPLKPLLTPVAPAPDPVPDPPPFPGNGWKCKHWNGECPNGILRNPDYSFVGCFLTGASSCAGKCTACGGSSGVVTWLCEPAALTDSCRTNLPVGQPVACGYEFEFESCRWVATKPPDEPMPTPNNCYCAGKMYPTGNICKVNACQ